MATTAPETATAPAAAAAADKTPNTPFYRLGGHEAMQAICNRFYDLMDSDPAYADLRAMHAPSLDRMKPSPAGFPAAWAGGPRDWFGENPGKCMMSAHKPYVITKEVAAQWGDAMRRAIADVAPAEADLAKAMGGVLDDLAKGMVNG